MRHILAAFALCFAFCGAALAQGTVVPHTCSQALPSGSLSTGTTTALIGPGATVPATMPTGGQAAALLTSAAGIQICGYVVNAVAASTVQLEYGTGSGCSSAVPLTPAWSFGATSFLADSADYFRGLNVPPGQTLCAVVGGTGPAQILVYYNNLGPQ